MKNIKLRLLISFVFTGVLIMLFTMAALSNADALAERYKRYITGTHIAAVEAEQMKLRIESASRDIISAVTLADPETSAEYLASAQRELDIMPRHYISISKAGASSDFVKAVTDEMDSSNTIKENLFKCIENGSYEIAKNIFFSEYQPSLERVTQLIDNYSGTVRSQSEAAFYDIGETKYGRIPVYVVICIFSIWLSIFSAFWPARETEQKLSKNEEKMAAARSANAELSAALKSEKERTGELSRRLNIAGAVINDTVHCLNDISEGRLGSVPEGDYGGTYDNVVSAFKSAEERLAEKLSETVSLLNSAADSVSAQADRLTGSIITLSRCAVERAGSAGELAMLADEVSEKMQGSDTAARNISSKAALAEKKLSESRSSAEEVYSCAENILKTCNETKKILKSAEEITRSANIMAVNTAKAAAGAGGTSSGRSFAVIADSARDLAGKASEISVLTNMLIKEVSSAAEGTSAAAAKSLEGLNAAKEENAGIYDALSELENAIAEQRDCVSRLGGAAEKLYSGEDPDGRVSEGLGETAEQLSAHALSLRGIAERFAS